LFDELDSKREWKAELGSSFPQLRSPPFSLSFFFFSLFVDFEKAQQGWWDCERAKFQWTHFSIPRVYRSSLLLSSFFPPIWMRWRVGKFRKPLARLVRRVTIPFPFPSPPPPFPSSFRPRDERLAPRLAKLFEVGHGIRRLSHMWPILFFFLFLPPFFPLLIGTEEIFEIEIALQRSSMGLLPRNT